MIGRQEPPPGSRGVPADRYGGHELTTSLCLLAVGRTQTEQGVAPHDVGATAGSVRVVEQCRQWVRVAAYGTLWLAAADVGARDDRVVGERPVAGCCRARDAE